MDEVYEWEEPEAQEKDDAPRVKQRDVRDESLKRIIAQKRNRPAPKGALGKVPVGIKMVRMKNSGRGR